MGGVGFEGKDHKFRLCILSLRCKWKGWVGSWIQKTGVGKVGVRVGYYIQFCLHAFLLYCFHFVKVIYVVACATVYLFCSMGFLV